MKLPWIAFFGVAAVVTPVDAQLLNLPTLGSSWISAAYPKIFYTSRNVLTAGLYYEQVLPPGFEDWDDPPPYRGKLSIDGQLSTSGSKQVTTEARLPNLVPGWRFVLSFDAQRLARHNYFGIGNDTEFDGDNVFDSQKHFYRSDIRRMFVRGEVQRAVVAGLRVLAGFHAERWRVDTLSGPSLLAMDADPSLGINTGETTVRFGLVFDTRDDEVTTSSGVLLQAIVGIADSTFAGDVSYTRKTLSAAAYVPVSGTLVLAGRVVGQSMTGSPPLASLHLTDAIDRPYGGLGGARSHRGLAWHRFVGPDKLYSNIDLRYRVAGEPKVFSLSVLGFLDAGRVFDAGDFRVTVDDLHVGGGAGAIATIGRSGVIGLTLGVAEDGLRPIGHAGWTF